MPISSCWRPSRKFLRRRAQTARQGGPHLRRRQRPRAAACRLCRARHARCGLPGQIFTSPTPDQIVEAAQELAGEAGVLFIVKNYAGDRMNFEMAAEIATCRNDDRWSTTTSRTSGRPTRQGRRGVAGTMIVEKMRRRRRRARRRSCERASRLASRSMRGRVRSASRCRIAPFRRPGRRPSRSVPTRWSWALASMASRAAARCSFARADAIAERVIARDRRRSRHPKSTARRCC